MNRELGSVCAGAAAAAVLIACTVFGCSQPVDATRAADIAREFAVAGQASNEAIYDVRTSDPSIDDGGDWRVQVDLLVTYAPEGATPDPSAQRGWIHYWIRVDAISGMPSIEAQG